ncbi:hypothetical protein [Haliscomenobacter hydrossis]|uniref:Uncharacterized protein n=1 Tax=Haliscomenobacter hydrossis (strain ATCC 27775 / DSM 1100 / LMG 10767 / O) TaxID=760192 RepID=F4L084_HALH1|nr:hypothetical protein [Haliscomenobacter hydrossis]AEE53757.1 hypothetical protein Halhy_5934 [Haliscomenobacter hydrossis DSM 1100]
MKQEIFDRAFKVQQEIGRARRAHDLAKKQADLIKHAFEFGQETIYERDRLLEKVAIIVDRHFENIIAELQHDFEAV